MSLYARLITLKQEEGSSTYDEDSFAGQVLSGNHHLPTPIESYIKALGHVVDNASIRYKLALPAWPEEDGTFGRMGPLTHWKYMSMPCPLVCRQRIQEDMRVTATPGVREWNLPVGIRPIEEGAGNECKKAWALLRDAFRRSHKKKKDTKSGQASVHEKNGVGTLPTTPSPAQTPKHPQPKGKRGQKATDETPSTVLMRYIIESKNNTPPPDDIEQVMAGVVTTLRSFPPRERAIAKAKIFKIVSDMEIDILSRPSTSSTVSTPST
ncbi:unnamed protein product, partial [Brenthis ino]